MLPCITPLIHLSNMNKIIIQFVNENSTHSRVQNGQSVYNHYPRKGTARPVYSSDVYHSCHQSNDFIGPLLRCRCYVSFYIMLSDGRNWMIGVVIKCICGNRSDISFTAPQDLTSQCQWSLIARFIGPTWAHLRPTGPRWAPCRLHEPCYMRYSIRVYWLIPEWISNDVRSRMWNGITCPFPNCNGSSCFIICATVEKLAQSQPSCRIQALVSTVVGYFYRMLGLFALQRGQHILGD